MNATLSKCMRPLPKFFTATPASLYCSSFNELMAAQTSLSADQQELVLNQIRTGLGLLLTQCGYGFLGNDQQLLRFDPNTLQFDKGQQPEDQADNASTSASASQLSALHLSFVVPACYLLQGMRLLPSLESSQLYSDNTRRVRDGLSRLSTHFSKCLEGGFQQLFEAMVGRILKRDSRNRLHCSVEVLNVDRTSSQSSVTITWRAASLTDTTTDDAGAAPGGSVQSATFDSLVVACPLDHSLSFLDQALPNTAVERDIFSRISYLGYASVAVSLSPLDPSAPFRVQQHGVFIPPANTWNTNSIGHLIGYFHESGKQLYIANLYFDILHHNEANVVAAVKSDFAAFNARVDSVAFVELWRTYMPHFRADVLLQHRPYEQIESVQGKARTHYCGSLFTFESVEQAVYSGQYVVERHFPRLSPTTSAATVPDNATAVSAMAALTAAAALPLSKPEPLSEVSGGGWCGLLFGCCR